MKKEDLTRREQAIISGNLTKEPETRVTTKEDLTTCFARQKRKRSRVRRIEVMMSEVEYRVNNADIPMLTRIYYTMQDIISLEKRGDWQRERMFSVTKRLRGMPGGGGLPSGIDATLCELDELNHEYGEKLRAYVYELKNAERVLNGIESANMRTFVRMYYVDNIGKAEIIRELGITEYGFARARRCVEQAPDMAHVRWHERFLFRKD